MPNGLIAEDSLRPHPDGLALKLTIPWYRSLWLSSVSTLRVTVDGVEIATDDLAFEIDGTRYAIAELPQQSETLWFRLVAGGPTPRYVRLRSRSSLSAVLVGSSEEPLPEAARRLVERMGVEIWSLRPTMSLGLGALSR